MEDFMNSIMRKLFILLCILTLTNSKVHWTLDQETITIGKPLTLKCETTTIDKRNLSRQWTGGQSNKLLCFNGIPSNPAKYNETLESNRTFLLQIKETEESDLECPYSCRVGFEFEERILTINETNFHNLPTDNTIFISYLKTSVNYTVQVDIRNVFPKPICSINLKERTLNLTVKHEFKTRVLYNLSLFLESKEELHVCGNDTIQINCKFGKVNKIYSEQHNVSCKGLIKTSEQLFSIILIIVLLLLILGFMLCVIYRRRYIKPCTKEYMKTPSIEIYLSNMTVPCQQEATYKLSNSSQDILVCNNYS